MTEKHTDIVLYFGQGRNPTHPEGNCLRSEAKIFHQTDGQRDAFAHCFCAGAPRVTLMSGQGMRVAPIPTAVGQRYLHAGLRAARHNVRRKITMVGCRQKERENASAQV